ncbi:MAG: tyrosine-type recombinase/integrase [Lachnospiraceae bacterium]|nr:tyrosine-type recombinase/integrase [Lachnospiraceae bacterium]
MSLAAASADASAASARMRDIVRDGGRYRLDIAEKKTGKKRTFTVPLVIYQFMENYCLRNKIGKDELIFKISERAVQKYLKKVVDYLGYENVGTHSFRKFFATEIYNNNGHDIALVQELLQHSNPSTTRRYIGIAQERVENAIEKHVDFINDVLLYEVTVHVICFLGNRIFRHKILLLD